MFSGFSWSFWNGQLTSVHLKPFESLPIGLLWGLYIQISSQNCAPWAKMMHGLNNSCADFSCTKSDSVFLGTAVGMGKRRMHCDKEMWNKMGTFKCRQGSQSTSRNSSELRQCSGRGKGAVRDGEAEGKSGIELLDQVTAPQRSR